MSLSSRSSATPGVSPTPFTCVRAAGGDGAAWVTPSGELDLLTAPLLDEALRAAQGEAQLVVLDLRQLEFLDSTGVHLIVDATARARADGRRLVVVRGPALVDQVFGLTDTTASVHMVDLPPRPLAAGAT
jgi:anti-sigma B factor antagonist